MAAEGNKQVDGAASVQTSARLTGDTITALVLEAGRLYGAGMVRSRSGWSRSVAGEWPMETLTVVPGVEKAPDASAQFAHALAASLTQARAALRADTVVLALPTSLLLLRVLRMPVLTREELADAVLLQMDKLSPFPGDELSIGWEVLAEDAEQITIFAAAAPDRHMQAIDQARVEAGLRFSRVDVALLAWWRLLREQNLLPPGDGRQAVLIAQGGEWDLLVLDRGLPVMARGLGRSVEDGDLARELALSLFQVEMESGPQSLQEVLVVATTAPDAAVLEPLRAVVAAEVRCIPAPVTATAADGLARRTVEGATLDLTPASWRQREQTAHVRRRLVLGLSAAAGLWVALLSTLLLGPFVTDQLTKLQKRRQAEIAASYQQVSDMRERVRLVRRYMDRSGSLLESLRAICAAQPEGVELSELSYDREKGCRFKGEAIAPALVYSFKEQVETTAPFHACKLGGVSLVPGSQKHRFEMDALLGEGSR